MVRECGSELLGFIRLGITQLGQTGNLSMKRYERHYINSSVYFGTASHAAADMHHRHERLRVNKCSYYRRHSTLKLLQRVQPGSLSSYSGIVHVADRPKELAYSKGKASH